jgi:hypothetical protein
MFQYISLMGSSSLTITSVSFNGASGSPANDMNVTLRNTGTKAVTVAVIKVNNIPQAFSPKGVTSNATLVAGETKYIDVTTTNWINGNTYKIDLYDRNNQVIGSTQQNAPGA